MDFLVNDLSFNGQFQDIASFKDSLNCLMKIREVVCRSGRNVYCQKSIFNAEVIPGMPMPQAVSKLSESERRSVVSWLQKSGPFWDEERQHQPGHWLEHNGQIVTDTAIGEAAWCNLNGVIRGLVSLEPSNWNFSPVNVDLVSDEVRNSVDVSNHWDVARIETFLNGLPEPINSWPSLRNVSIARYESLTFAHNAFSPLEGHPFSSAASERIFFILYILNKFKTCFDATGARTKEGNEIYQDYFTGKKGEGGRGAMISDSSDDEKAEFESELTFNHPGQPGNSLFCPWHGKVQTPQFRVHFSSPIRADEPLYVVYVGPKITKK